MSTSSEIIRIAAKGDGITADGQHVSGAAPGDVLNVDGTLQHGPHHIAPICRHFGKCGGCQLQHVDEESLREFVTSRVANAAEGQEIAVGELLPTHLSPPKSRRRATLHAASRGGKPLIGFRESGSHKIVGLTECHIVSEKLFAVVEALRAILARRKGKFAVDIELTEADQGVDCSLKNLPVEGLEQTEAILDFARDLGLARLTLDQGYGAETLWEPEPVTVTLSGIPVGFPSGGFLQATQDGEDVLVGDAQSWLSEARTVADLFSGLGTFAFALAGKTKVLAVEAARDTHLACQLAARVTGKPVHSIHRDLFRNPLQLEELNKFSAILLDPPRAGARDQIELLAQSTVEKVVYISCNPSSWARDAKKLIAGGYRLEKLRPVGQFRWSTHVELTSLFVRPSET
ncbi:class I SAM-dependent RNA methyltransferase [Pontixanthobacter aestiaquae]|uniref:Class I SAM-dependent RNA methyltransferase n=1 Tax=Pontixanthobacter aestiaquae TaxID=1509367 RepID=A0A844ZD56_9SPHN|nr:class I SAM-dependent RNA methyltransferase [Pontixanthobacter aestiaquae]MDN3645269.1 class I SAM-dependent RNA methyltransferase [Pontixanthobacter aestiaquae]MXO83729.1 class I SAM-dependent RNA methyltransferase [Pontixanthobacter aestiaquae]